MILFCANYQLHRCFLQIKDYTERLKSCEQELQVNLSTLLPSWFITPVQPGLLFYFWAQIRASAWCIQWYQSYCMICHRTELHIWYNWYDCVNLVSPPFSSIISTIGPFGFLKLPPGLFYFVTSLLQLHNFLLSYIF